MNRKIFLFLSVLAVAFAARSASITLSSPGTLASALTEDPATVTQLAVTGPIDARDLQFISFNMPALESLDLSEATVKALQNAKVGGLSQKSYRDHVLPPMSLCGVPAKSIKLPATLREIGQAALSATGITELTIPAGVTTIAAGAFASCEALTAVTIPASVTTIGMGAFKDCNALKSATVATANIPDNCFADCPKLETVILGEVKSIGKQAFADCIELKTITLDATNLSKIGAEAFRNTSLSSLDLQQSQGMSEIGAWAFADNPLLTTLHLPQVVLTIGRGYCFNDQDLATFTAAETPTVIPVAAYKGCRSVNYLRMLGQRAQTVEPYAFAGLESLEKIYLPSSLMEIGTESMTGMNSLKQIQAPALMTVPELGDNVWGDLDRSTVLLGVEKTMADAFGSTPVWQDFKIVDAEHIDDPTIGITPAEVIPQRGTLVCSLSGSLLRVSTTDLVPLETIMVHDLQGRLLLSLDAGAATEAVIDTDRWASNRIFITTAAGGRAAKVAR